MKKSMLNLIATLLLVAFAKAQTIPAYQEIARKVQANEAQVVDARSAQEFAQSHIKGAVNINPAKASYQSQIQLLDSRKPIVIYAIASGRSNALAKTLHENGYKNVWVLEGGFSKWIGSGYPIENFTKKATITTAVYSKLTQSNNLVLVNFSSKYCGSCKRLIPMLDSLAQQKSFGAKIIKIEAYEQASLVKEKNINSLPTLILYKDGQPVWQKAGQATTREILAEVVKNQTSSASTSLK